MKDLRRVIVTLVIGSFSLAALMGIAALLGGDFGETQGRVLATTAVVGIESVAMLCYLALAGHRHAWVGMVGAVVSLVATGTVLTLVWGSEPAFDDGIWQLLAVTVTVAATLAQASLLIALASRGRVRPLLYGTLVAAGVVAAMIIGPVLDESDPGGDYWRVFGVVTILDVLGTLVLIALAAFGRVVDRAGSPAAPPARHAEPASVLDRELQARIAGLAAERGTTPAGLVRDALDEYLARHPVGG